MLSAFTTSDSFPLRLLRFLLLIAGIGLGTLYIVLPLDWHTQIALGACMVVAAILVGKLSTSPLITMALMVLSAFATIRYAWWRISTSIAFFRDPSNPWDWVDAACICILLCAETYAFIILFLGFMQTIWPLKRPPVPLPADHAEWPHVDLLIPTYNEPLNVVKFTAMAAYNVDWPADKLHIYILDDGRRDEFRDFAAEAGIGYMTRDDNAHAKAGNINRALQRLDSPFVAIFDCDHLPTRSFLQVTMGWFFRESRLAMVQTPHHFYSADPFERNLKQFRKIPNEGELFYGVVQDGNDFWNATFFCGSCAVLRRTALEEIGGIAVETVTEDAHTSLRMQMRGWNTAYINIPQAAGLATERLSGHIQQRVRWARGMIQILRTDNPLFAKGLRFAQRICYFNAMTHFLYAVPRLIFLTAPLVYLFFSRSNVPGYWAAILAYALPHLVLSNLTNSRIQGQHRHSFWNEIYETVLAPYILLPTLIALINPKLGTFNVTAKGGFVEETYFDGKIAAPFVALLGLNFAGLLMVIPRLNHIAGLEFFWDGTHPGTIVMNAIWCLFNIVILGVATTVAREEIQRRGQVRIDFVLPAKVRFADGTLLFGTSVDVSISGIALSVHDHHNFTAGERVTLILPLRVGEAELPANIIDHKGDSFRLQFADLSLLEQEMLTTILYSRADAWLSWGETRQPDRPLRSFYRILTLSVRGLSSTFAMLFHRKHPPTPPPAPPAAPLKPYKASQVVPALLLCLALGSIGRAQTRTPHPRALQTVTPPSATFHSAITLKDLGVLEPIDLRGADSFRSISFSLPLDEVTTSASLHLIYRFSSLASSSGRLKLLLNGTPIATLSPASGRTQPLLDTLLPVPPELLVRNNQLTFEFTSRTASRCDDPAHTPASGAGTTAAPSGLIAIASTLDLSGQRLQLPADLHQLPLPFLDPQITRHRILSVVLPSSPSTKAIQAAGIAASWFGVVADFPVPRFPVTFDAIPTGNILLIAEASSSLISTLNLGPITGPTVALRPNPNDALGSVLILTGADSDQLLLAAQALALQPSSLHGLTVSLENFDLPSPRLADDAPRWARSDQKVALWGAVDTERSSDGATPLQLFLRVPPDLDYAGRANLNLHIDYRYTSPSLDPASSLLIRLNGAQSGSILLRHNRNPALPTGADMPLPTVNLRPFSNSLTAQWLVQPKEHGHCVVAAPTGFQGTILQSSFLDLRGLPHWAALPNLELFSNAGFPFTRFADLSQTTIILPDQPSASEIEVVLTLLAHFSAQTGTPALRVTIGTPADVHPGLDSDLLLIGTAQNNPAIALTNEHLPVFIDGQQLTLNAPTTLTDRLRSAWTSIRTSLESLLHAPATSHAPDFDIQQLPDALLEGIESPYSPRRTLVTLSLNEPASAGRFLSAFLDASHSSDISGDVSVLAANRFQSFRLGANTYTLGHRPWLTRLEVLLIGSPWIMVLGLALFSLLAGGRMHLRLQRKSAVRLHLAESL